MRILDIDAGNSRLKWRLLEAGREPQRGVVVAGRETGLPLEFISLLESHSVRLPDMIRVGSVRGAAFEAQLISHCMALYSLSPSFAKVQKNCAGVEVAYAEPASLGVDRWLAMLAAHHAGPGAVCIVDCGSAMTVDLVDERGRHQGGYIVPGLNMMQQSLGDGTADLPYLSGAAQSLDPGTSTAAAINHGILTMALGMLERVYNNSSAARWYLCGGDAAVLSSFISWPHQIEPELVLDGLSVALKPEEAAVRP